MSTLISSDRSVPAGGERRVVLAASGVERRYGGTRALRGADLELVAGRVHALLGENGAGKSTMVRILAGAERPDAGSLTLDGKPVAFGSTAEAMHAGVAPVYQDPQDFPSLNAVENLFLGQEETIPSGLLNMRSHRERAISLLEQVGLPPEVATIPVRELTIAQRQLVQIARSLVRSPKILLLDEPSTVLTATEIDGLFDVIRRTTANGTAVVLISHRLDEVFAIADDITVLRDGLTARSAPTNEWTRAEVIRSMTGHDVDVVAKEERAPDHVDSPYRAEGLSLDRTFEDINFEVAPGEIHCLLGLVGSGASELAAIFAGAERASAGRVLAGGRQIRNLRDGRAAGIRYLPKDRKRDALFPSMSLAINTAAGNADKLAPRGVLRQGHELRVMRDWMQKLRVKAPSPATPIAALSGGNQQKVLLARVFIAQPKVLVLDEPTRGVDIGAREEIHTLIEARAAAGDAVLVVSSDIEEVRRIADRITVLCKGKISGRFGPGAPVAELLAAAVGAKEEVQP